MEFLYHKGKEYLVDKCKNLSLSTYGNKESLIKRIEKV